jgi:hypothetical protein
MQMKEKICLTGLLLGMNHGCIATIFGGKCFADDKEVETEVQKWLIRQSEYFYAAGFDALEKRWD